MRLSASQVDVIRSITRATMGEGATAFVYGSRLDDGRRGGDLDLLVETEQHVTLLQRADLKLRLEDALQIPVDVVTHVRGTPMTAFQQLALARGVALEKP